MSPIEPNALLQKLFALCSEAGASDLHLAENEPCFLRVAGQLVAMDEKIPTDSFTQLIRFLVGQQGLARLEERGSFDGAVGIHDKDGNLFRFRYNIFRTSGKTSIAFRQLEDRFRTLAELGLPNHLYQVTEIKDGLILVAGPTGSGKSTTLATLIDHINQNRSVHIITIEDPIEYLHQPQQARITQRQVGVDTPSFNQAVFDAVRQDPDVVLVGELRDRETIQNAIEVALTGHLVLATVHAGDCVGAVERIVNVFPGDQQPLIRQMLSSSLRAIVSQHLLPGTETPPNRVLASEILYQNSAVSNLIRNGNVSQLRSVLETGATEGMHTLDSCLAKLVASKALTPATARTLARNPKFLTDLPRAI